MTYRFLMLRCHTVKKVSDISGMLELPQKPQSYQYRAMKVRYTSSNLMEVVNEFTHAFVDSGRVGHCCICEGILNAPFI